MFFFEPARAHMGGLNDFLESFRAHMGGLNDFLESFRARRNPSGPTWGA